MVPEIGWLRVLRFSKKGLSTIFVPENADKEMKIGNFRSDMVLPKKP